MVRRVRAVAVLCMSGAVVPCARRARARVCVALAREPLGGDLCTVLGPAAAGGAEAVAAASPEAQRVVHVLLLHADESSGAAALYEVGHWVDKEAGGRPRSATTLQHVVPH